MNSDSSVAAHANSDRSEVVVGTGSKRERLSRMLAAEDVEEASRPGGPSLSRREIQLLRFAIQGLTNNEIAGRVRLSAKAVQGQLRAAFAKLARRSSGAAARRE